MLPSHNAIRKVCALVAVTLILPAIAYADRDHDKDKDRDNHEQRVGDRDRDDRIPVANAGWDEHRWGNHDTNKDRDKNIPVVPEANAGWVLVPFFGAVLLFSARQLFRGKATE